MARILIMEGNDRARREKSGRLGIRSSSEIYAQSIAAHFPDVEIEIVNAADPDGALPAGRGFGDYDGFVVSGSSLHAYDRDSGVVRQIETLRAAAEYGMPVLGSCWGLQIAAVAAGGEVRRNPAGREVGLARKILINDQGGRHPLLSGRGPVFDAPCIHYDEVTRLPDGARLLAGNDHSRVQAAVIPLGKSEIWAVQYHPEFDLEHLADLYGLYGEDMVVQGFFADRAALECHQSAMRALARTPSDFGLAWQLGIDADLLDDRRRRAEIIAWMEHCVLRRAQP